MPDFDQEAALDRFAQSAESTPPTFGGSVFNSAKEAFLAVPALVVSKAEKIGTPVSPWLQSWKSTYDRIQIENQRESELLTSGQMAVRKVASAIPNLIGAALDPVSAATGYIGGATVGIAAEAIAPQVAKRAARQALIAELGTKAGTEAIPRTIGEVAAAGAHGAGTMAGFSVPHAYFGTDNAKDMAVEIGANGAMGIVMGPIGYGMGVLWHGLFPKAGKTPLPGTPEVPGHIADLDAAFHAGQVSKPEYELMRDYLTNPNDPSLQKRFSEVLLKRGHEINSATYQAYFKMIDDEGMANLKNIFPTELANHELATDKDALSKFTLHTNLDRLRENPELVDGLRGFVDAADHGLEQRRKTFREIDQKLNEHFEKSINENMMFSQSELLKYMEKVGFEESHIKNLPIEMPEILNKHAKIQTKINQLKEKIRVSGKNKQVERRVRELEASLPKIHTPKEELFHIKEKLLSDKAFPRNASMTKLYNRLSELSEVWHQAKLLKDHIDMSHEFIDRQEAFRDVAKAFIDVLNSNIDRFANPERVNNYLRERIGQITSNSGEQRFSGAIIPLSEIERSVKEARKIPANEDEILADYEQSVKDSGSQSTIDGFSEAKERYEQFRENEKAFADMIDCFRRK